MKYTAYDGKEFENFNACVIYNIKLREKYSMDNVDPIYLLSNEEYEYYKKDIPLITGWWWLQSPGPDSYSTACIFDTGFVYHHACVSSGNGAVRPALNLEHLKSKIYGAGYRLVNGRFPYRFTWAGVTWRTLGEDPTAIAEMPIFYSKFDDKSNNYETSFIRNKLLTWYNFRVSNHFIVQEVIGY